MTIAGEFTTVTRWCGVRAASYRCWFAGTPEQAMKSRCGSYAQVAAVGLPQPCHWWSREEKAATASTKFLEGAPIQPMFFEQSLKGSPLFPCRLGRTRDVSLGSRQKLR